MNEALRKLEALLANASAIPSRFPPNSRYSGLPVLTIERGGRTLAYVARRFIAAPENLPPARQHTIVEGDRLDLLAGRAIGDPELWWRIADANRTLRPDELLDRPGDRVRIPQPDGFVPAVSE